MHIQAEVETSEGDFLYSENVFILPFFTSSGETQSKTRTSEKLSATCGGNKDDNSKPGQSSVLVSDENDAVFDISTIASVIISNVNNKGIAAGPETGFKFDKKEANIVSATFWCQPGSNTDHWYTPTGAFSVQQIHRIITKVSPPDNNITPSYKSY